MEDNEIYSPPFAKNADTPSQLFTRLGELYDWTISHQDWANMEASRLGAPDDPFIPPRIPLPDADSTRFMTSVAVPDMFVSWQAVRAIREKYDELVRNYDDEDSWKSDACVFHRIHLIRMAALLLSVAFLDREKREAREADMVKQSRKQMIASLKKAFGSINLFVANDENEDIDFDSLFNPDSDNE